MYSHQSVRMTDFLSSLMRQISSGRISDEVAFEGGIQGMQSSWRFLNPITKEATFCLNTQKSVIFSQCPFFQLEKKSRKKIYAYTYVDELFFAYFIYGFNKFFKMNANFLPEK